MEAARAGEPQRRCEVAGRRAVGAEVEQAAGKLGGGGGASGRQSARTGGGAGTGASRSASTEANGGAYVFYAVLKKS